MKQLELVRPNQEDAQQVMEWRNDPLTATYSFHSEPKKWPAFAPEFASYFAFADLPPLFVVEKGARSAFLHFKPVVDPVDILRKCCSISINVSPNCRGKGLGTAILKDIQGWLRQQGYNGAYAEVKPENAASIQAFKNAGFQQLLDGTKVIPETDAELPICRFYVELSPKASSKVFVIAEIGSNWRMGTPDRDWDMARKLIDIAKDASVDAVKFQLFRPETLYVENAGTPDYLLKAGINKSMKDLFNDLMMPYEMLEQLHTYCQECQIELMATPFSPEEFSVIDPLVKRHKIASYEIGHVHLLQLAARSQKPLFLSTGAATPDEIAWAVDTFRDNGGKDLTLLQCTASYSPAPASSMHLRTIPWLMQRFHAAAGLSDHSRHPLCAPVAAVALGATVIEKHFTLDNRLPGPDHSFALQPNELREMVGAIRLAEEMRGAPVKLVDDADLELRAFVSRGIQATTDIQIGELLQEGHNIAILRPGRQPKGVHSRFLQQIEGQKAKRLLKRGEGIQHGDYA